MTKNLSDAICLPRLRWCSPSPCAMLSSPIVCNQKDENWEEKIDDHETRNLLIALRSIFTASLSFRIRPERVSTSWKVLRFSLLPPTPPKLGDKWSFERNVTQWRKAHQFVRRGKRGNYGKRFLWSCLRNVECLSWALFASAFVFKTRRNSIKCKDERKSFDAKV